MNLWLARNPTLVEIGGPTEMSGCGDFIIAIVVAENKKQAIDVFEDHRTHCGFTDDISQWKWQLLGTAKDPTPRVEAIAYAAGPEDQPD